MGDSAGGNLVIVTAWAAASSQAPTTCPELGPVPVPGAVIAGYPVADPRDAYANGREFLGARPREFTEHYLGGPPSAYPERLATISPATYLTAAAPPTLIIQPDGDDFIPAAGNDAVVALARASGMDVTLVHLPLLHHSFDLPAGGLGSQVKRSIATHYLAERGLAPARI
jgi:acetyl esterase/lipase